MIRIILLFITCAVAMDSTNAQNWKLILHNDHDGNTVYGSLVDLHQAVRNGEEIRIAWGAQSIKDPKRKVEHLADAGFLTILSDSSVFAQIRTILGQKPNFQSDEIILKEKLDWSMIGSTNGKMESLTTNRYTGEVIDHKISKSWFKWYIRESNP